MSHKSSQAFLIFFLLLSPQTFAAAIDDVREDLAELKRVHEAQATNLATALNQIQQVLGEFQKIHGQVDQSLHNSNEQSRLLTDSQLRLQVLEDKIQSLTTQLEELKTAGLLPPDQVKNLNEFQIFQKGLGKVNANQYKEAILSFKSFLVSYPKSIYADNAQYWIGECYFAMRDFAAAVAEFQNVIKKYPSSRKVAASLLKQGLSFFEMQSFDDSRAFLSKLISRFPGSSEAIRAAEAISRINSLLEAKTKGTSDR